MVKMAMGNRIYLKGGSEEINNIIENYFGVGAWFSDEPIEDDTPNITLLAVYNDDDPETEDCQIGTLYVHDDGYLNIDTWEVI